MKLEDLHRNWDYFHLGLETAYTDRGYLSFPLKQATISSFAVIVI
jgi:hypothetical protein